MGEQPLEIIFTKEEIKENYNFIIQHSYEKLFRTIEDYYNKYLEYPTIRHDSITLKKCEKYNSIDDNVRHIK